MSTRLRLFLRALRTSIIVNVVIFPLVMLATYGAPSCGGTAGQIAAGAGSDWLACAKSDVGGVVAEAVGAVEAIASLNATTLEADALALIGSVGFDAVDCAVKVVEEIIAAETAAPVGSGSGGSATVAAGADHLRRASAIKRIRAVVEQVRQKYTGSGGSAHK
jgi:hypothetical protein